MKYDLHPLLITHKALLCLFPSSFRKAFGEEIHAVFSQTAREAADQGGVALVALCLREFYDLPLMAIQEHLQPRKNPLEAGAQQFAQTEPVTKWEVLVALAAFLVPGGYIFINSLPRPWFGQVVFPSLLGLLLVGTIAGLVKRFPRWSLSYFGLVLSAVVFLFLFHWEAKRIGTFLAARFVVQPNDELGRLLLLTFWEGVVWLSLLVLVSLGILALALLPRSRPLISQIKEDWTRLSYLVYNGSMLALVLAFDEYRYAEPYALVALACLAGGAWGYLRSRHPTRGFLALLVGGSLSMWVVAMGLWMLVPRQDWAMWFRWLPPERVRWFEAERALIEWLWMVVVLTLPSIWVLIPRLRNRRPTAYSS